MVVFLGENSRKTQIRKDLLESFICVMVMSLGENGRNSQIKKREGTYLSVR